MSRTLILFLCLGSAGWGQTQSRRPNRRTVLRQLGDDLAQALANANFKDKDRKKLDQAHGLVREQAEVRGRLTRTGREDLRKALSDISKRAKYFQPDDRRSVENDLRQAHNLGLDRPMRRRAYRRPPPLPWPPMRRWP